MKSTPLHFAYYTVIADVRGREQPLGRNDMWILAGLFPFPCDGLYLGANQPLQPRQALL